MAQLVKRQTLDLSSGHDLMVHEVKPSDRLCTDSTEPDLGLELTNCEIMT